MFLVLADLQFKGFGDSSRDFRHLVQTTADGGYRVEAMDIRPARPGDGEQLARLWFEFGAYYAQIDPERFRTPDREGLTEWLEERLARPPDAARLWLVAEEDGEIAGYAVGSLIEPMADAERQLLTDLAYRRLGVDALHVAEPHRRKGIAASLVAELEDWARRKGATIALAETYVHSPSSVPFWREGAGYERTSVRFWKRLR
jgi:GNAT superfamily N-acetyltransferase